MNNRGISPVIATVIIVAVAIAIAIAVAFWMTGIVGLFTGFEEVQVVSAYPEYNDSSNKFTITITVKNTGTSPASVDNIFINGKPVDTTFTVTWNGTAWPTPITTAKSLNTGATVPITITFNNNAKWAGGTLTHGVSVEVKLHTASGKEYPKLIVLP